MAGALGHGQRSKKDAPEKLKTAGAMRLRSKLDIKFYIRAHGFIAVDR
jgi:hypothetical protein